MKPIPRITTLPRLNERLSVVSKGGSALLYRSIGSFASCTTPTRSCFPSDTCVLYFSNFLPEPNGSAAGVRTSLLIEKLLNSEGISAVHFISSSHRNSSKVTDRSARVDQHVLNLPGVQHHLLPPNRSQRTRELLLSLQTKNLVAIFDRFYTEEMYSFHVHNLLPHATMVLDMQDMHSLRRFRQKAVQAASNGSLETVTANNSMLPSSDDATLLRELSSIHRCDLTLVCSPYETSLLTNRYGIPERQLVTAPLFGDLKPANACLDYEARRDICFVGGFRHDPNRDAVQQLYRLWPRIRDQLPDKDTKLHVYGAYCPDQLKSQLHDPKTGFLVHGFVESLEHAMADKRCLVAPIRFGAGIKGKIVDAWTYRTPVVTTSIGMEGIIAGAGTSNLFFVADSDDDFVGAVVSVYTDKEKWEQALVGIEPRLKKLSSQMWPNVCRHLVGAIENLHDHRMQDYIRAVIWQQSLRSTEYLSRYIETKEYRKAN